MRTRFYRNPVGRGFAGGAALVRLLAKGIQPFVFVAFRASHPAKPSSRQRGFVQRFLKGSHDQNHCSVR